MPPSDSSTPSVQAGQAISFDTAGAPDVAGALISLATSLGEGASVFGKQAFYVTMDWNGQFRAAFDTWASAYMSQAPQLAELLLQYAADITAASQVVQGYNTLVTTAPPGSAPAVPDPTGWAGM